MKTEYHRLKARERPVSPMDFSGNRPLTPMENLSHAFRLLVLLGLCVAGLALVFLLHLWWHH